MRRLIIISFAAASSVLGTGCFAGVAVSGLGNPGAGGIVSDITVPASYFSPTTPPPPGGTVAHGEACITSLFGLITWGAGGYNDAYNRALETSGGSSLFDVRVDSKRFNVLGLYATNCTELEGRVAK